MEASPLHITFLDHSGFFVETSDCSMLFDFSSGRLPENITKPLYIFVSHRHGDHFNKDIFRWGEHFQNTKYILSDDIKTTQYIRNNSDITSRLTDRIIFIAPDEEISVDNLKIRTLRSTDAGVAFLVTASNRVIYHAGDLHWWLWDCEDTPESAAKMTTAFKKEIEKLKSTHIDVAFLTLDSRQSDDEFWLGLDYYARNVQIDHIFPMHCWGKYQIIDRMKNLPCAASYKDKIIDIKTEGEHYDL